MSADVGYENLIVERLDGGVGLVRLDRPGVLNAPNQKRLDELVLAFADLAASPEGLAAFLEKRAPAWQGW